MILANVLFSFSKYIKSQLIASEFLRSFIVEDVSIYHVKKITIVKNIQNIYCLNGYSEILLLNDYQTNLIKDVKMT